MAAVITIDGPSGTGKGTISILLAKKLGWHYLDSGALYRGLAWGILDAGIDPLVKNKVASALPNLVIRLGQGVSVGDQRVLCNDCDITDLIRTESVGMAASKVAGQEKVRERLLELQRAACQAPGLIADGRDMGTVVFPGAEHKFYLDASTCERAKRRHNQLKQQGISVNLRSIEQGLIERDQRDRDRAICPLMHADDAIVIDTSDLTVEAVLKKVLSHMPT